MSLGHAGRTWPGLARWCGRASMGPQQPALLLRRVLNVERAPEVRRERLSSGMYELAFVRCRLCHTELGWRYLSAASQARPPADTSTPVSREAAWEYMSPLRARDCAACAS